MGVAQVTKLGTVQDVLLVFFTRHPLQLTWSTRFRLNACVIAKMASVPLS